MSNDNDNDDDFMKSLQSRVAQVQSDDTQLPIIVLDTMLPRQRLKIEVENDIFQALIKRLMEQERPRFGMVGVATLAETGQNMPLQNGVEVEWVGTPTVVEAPAASSTLEGGVGRNSNGKALRVTLKAGRRFRIDATSLQTNPAGWTEARVQFLQAPEGDDSSPEESDTSDAVLTEVQDPVSLARARQLAAQLTADDNNHLVNQWMALARTKEHHPGQIDQLLQDLGPMPPATSPTDLALWVGALINPLPGLGVAMEIRPQLLMARSAEERIGVVVKALQDSISHMDGSKPLF